MTAPADTCEPRLLVLSAFPGEIDMFIAEAAPGEDDIVQAGGKTFYLGQLRGNDVVMAMTGIGLNNAADMTAAALEHFRCGDDPAITGVVFSGVSGGKTKIGDVTVPREWTEADGDTYAVDPDMLAVATAVAPEVEPALARATPVGDPACVGIDPRAATTVEIPDAPEIIVGGTGRSSDPFGGRTLPCFPFGGDVFGCKPCRAPGVAVPDVAGFATGIAPFVDPAFFTDFFANPPATSGADADDMETAASARVAAGHGVPFIAFRALSDGLGDPLMLPGFPFQFFYYRQLAADNAATVALAFLQAWAAR